jgi:hypothetical protein
MMEILQNVLIWMLLLTGAFAWALGAAVAVFYWLCARPPEDEGDVK